MKPILSLLTCFLFASLLYAQPDTLQKIIEGRKNSVEQQQKPYVILISADGFRYDYAQKYNATNLLALSDKGVRADAMIPSYPSLTFPNHYTIVTGLYPSHHGIVSNYFYDPGRKQLYSMHAANIVRDGSWYGGTPLWVLAEKQHMLTANFFWVGSEANIQGTLPTYYYAFNDSLPMNHRIQVVVDWLRLPPEKRPHFIAFYIYQTDRAGHTYGPEAPQTEAAVHFVDSTVQQLTDAVRQTGLPVNFIFVSDHGMTKIDVDHSLPLPPEVDTSKFIIPRGAELVALYAKDSADIVPTYNQLKKNEKDFTVYLSTNMPAHLHYARKDDSFNRIGDILLVPTWPHSFNLTSRPSEIGAHGFDPFLIKDMFATFLAWGPAFKEHVTVSSFENVNVFPVITTILGLQYKQKIDGSPALATKILR